MGLLSEGFWGSLEGDRTRGFEFPECNREDQEGLQKLSTKDCNPSDDVRLKQEIGRKHTISIVQGQFVVPDVRLEYEDRDGNDCRVDLEYLTETYRQGDISAKAQAGFSLYAPHDQAARLHRVLDQHHIMTEILSI